MRKVYIVLLIFGLATCKSGYQPKMVEHFGEGILVLDKIDFEKDSSIRKELRDQCQLPKELAKYIDQFAAKHYAQVLVNTDITTVPVNTEVLRVKIVEVMEDGEGTWSSGKFVSISGTLQKHGKMLGDFKAKRICGGGVFGAYKATCSITKRCLKALGKDIAEWLQHHPAKNDVLGDY